MAQMAPRYVMTQEIEASLAKIHETEVKMIELMQMVNTQSAALQLAMEDLRRQLNEHKTHEQLRRSAAKRRFQSE